MIVSGLVGFTQCGLITVGLWQMRISSNERNRQLDRQDKAKHGAAANDNAMSQQHGKALEQQGKVLEQQITMLQRQDTVMERQAVMERQDKALERQGKALESASLGILELLKRSA